MTDSIDAGATTRPKVALAIQGGGAHGAYAWGVVDRLLEENWEIEAISGASAGAINGAALCLGWDEDGAAGARRQMARVWDFVASQTHFSPLQPSLIDRYWGNGDLRFSAGYHVMDLISRIWSPYQHNPLDVNPVRGVMAIIDIDRLRRIRSPKLYVSATNVLTGRLRIFADQELSSDALAASACLPFLNQAVEIDGEQFWDGGFLGNPALDPLIEECTAPDLVLVQVSPIANPHAPRSISDIFDRVTEISFSGALMRELKLVEMTNRLLEAGAPAPAGARKVNLHMVSAEEAMTPFTTSSKLNSDRRFIYKLFDLGRATADAWVKRHGAQVGRRSTLDAEDLFSGGSGERAVS